MHQTVQNSLIPPADTVGNLLEQLASRLSEMESISRVTQDRIIGPVPQDVSAAKPSSGTLTSVLRDMCARVDVIRNTMENTLNSL